ncbi:MAG: ABC transporter ATP-binding protein [Acidimicrobiia bacterium]|nr:ABC transporter ATP-binding protein [Acidimicrobiia bacterium]
MTTAVEPILHVDDVTVRFGGVTAVNSVTLSVERGARWAVIGPNGAGKTTLFKTISGEVRPTEGRVHLFGVDTSRSAPYAKAQRGLGRTYQVTELFQALTVEENLSIAAQARAPSRFTSWRPLRIKGWIDERITGVLAQLHLSAERHTVVSELSHGEQRQLEIALALATEPEILLLDEPAAGLSAAERRIMRDLVEELSRDLTIVLIEHDMEIALELVEHVLVLDNGQVIAEGDPDSIRADDRVQAVYLRAD